MCKHAADAELLQDWGVREDQVVPDRRSDMYQVSQAYPLCMDMLHALAVSGQPIPSYSPGRHLPCRCTKVRVPDTQGASLSITPEKLQCCKPGAHKQQPRG